MAVDRIRDITHKVVCSLSTDPLVRYIPPYTGTVRIRVLEGYSTGNEFRTAPISHTKVRGFSATIVPVDCYFLCICLSQVKQVIETANASSNPLVLLLYSLDCSTVYLEEARVYFNSISRTEDSVATLANILMHMHGAGDAMRLIKSVVGNDIVRIRRLKQALGNAYGPLIGVYSGYYTLDLSNERDRLCLKKLIERSILNENSRKKKRKWDTSQHGHWNCFRNELHHPTKGSTAADMTISPKHYFPIPKHGRLEFDFVNTERPDPATCRPVHEDRLIDVSVALCCGVFIFVTVELFAVSADQPAAARGPDRPLHLSSSRAQHCLPQNLHLQRFTPLEAGARSRTPRRRHPPRNVLQPGRA